MSSTKPLYSITTSNRVWQHNRQGMKMSRRYDDWFFNNLDTLTEEFIKEKNAQDAADYEEYVAQHYGEWEDWVWERFVEQ